MWTSCGEVCAIIGYDNHDADVVEYICSEYYLNVHTYTWVCFLLFRIPVASVVMYVLSWVMVSREMMAWWLMTNKFISQTNLLYVYYKARTFFIAWDQYTNKKDSIILTSWYVCWLIYTQTILTCHYFFVIQSVFNNTIHATWCIIAFDKSIPM